MRVPQPGKIMREQGTRRVYRIVVRSELGDRYACAFEGMRMEMREGQTILTGEVKDQPHLFGVLQRLNGLGLKLLSVQAMPAEEHSSSERDREP
jgi:outer membrane PBP1 activator LpoA protein